MACRVLEKGLSPICSSITSLPWALSRLATASTSKAVSPVRPEAKALKVSDPLFIGWLSLLGGDGLCQGPHNGRDDVIVHHFLGHFALMPVGLAKVLDRLTATVLENREINDDRRLRKLYDEQ